jgi:hypothetical protein
MNTQISLILGNIGELRGVNHHEHGQLFSIRDFINACNKKPLNNAYGRVTWNNLLKDKNFTEEFEAVNFFYDLIISGSQGIPTACTGISGLQTIMTHLPGKVAASYRKEINDVFLRVLAGDRELIKTIETNAASNEILPVLARDELKRKKNEQDDASSGDEIDHHVLKKKMQVDIMETYASATLKMTQALSLQREMYASLCPNGIMEDRARVHYKDMLLNMSNALVALTERPAITAPPAEAVSDNRPITMSTYAIEIGLRPTNSQLQKAGKIMAQLYREQYNEDPPTHEQYVDGAVRMVKSYFSEHKGLMRRALEESLKK